MKASGHLLSLFFLILLFTTSSVYAQLPVTDAIVSLQTTATALQMVLSVANQVLELTGLDEIVLGDDVGTDLEQLAALREDAQGLQTDLANIQLQITLLFDLSAAPRGSSALRDQMAAIRQLTWQVNVDALRTESLLQSSADALRRIVRLIEGIGGLLGNEQANQTLAQMEAKLTVELIKLRTQTAATNRAQAFDRLRQPLIEQSISNINEAIMEDYPQR